MTYITKVSLKPEITLSTLIGRKVTVHLSSNIKENNPDFFLFTYSRQQCLRASHLCLLNPSFRYVKKYQRLECRGTVINFSYEHHDIRRLCATNNPVTLEVVGGEVMGSVTYWNGDRLEPITKGKLALLSGGRVHVYGVE